MWLFDTAGGGGGLASSLCCKLLAWKFSACGFACGLLGACHGDVLSRVERARKWKQVDAVRNLEDLWRE